jgi:hypothetical protein
VGSCSTHGAPREMQETSCRQMGGSSWLDWLDSWTSWTVGWTGWIFGWTVGWTSLLDNAQMLKKEKSTTRYYCQTHLTSTPSGFLKTGEQCRRAMQTKVSVISGRNQGFPAETRDASRQVSPSGMLDPFLPTALPVERTTEVKYPHMCDWHRLFRGVCGSEPCHGENS